jgi:hypothetical protein
MTIQFRSSLHEIFDFPPSSLLFLCRTHLPKNNTGRKVRNTTTLRLAMKEIFPSFNAFHAAWFCHNHAHDKKYMVLENKAIKCFRANCFMVPATKSRDAKSECQCHIYAAPIKSQDGCFTDEWIINSFHSGLTCSDNTCARKRQYKCLLLESVSPALAAHIPNKKHGRRTTSPGHSM